MIMRITWGKLRAGTWNEYEQAYRATAGKEVPGLRGRWLAQDVNDPDGGFAVSLYGRHSTPCRRMSRVRSLSRRFNRPCSPFLGEYTTYRCDVKYEE